MKGIHKALVLAVYFALAIPMFYFSEGALQIGGFGFMYMYLFGIGIIILAFVAFMIWPDAKRAILSSKYSLQIASPYIWSLLYSFLFWAFTMAEFRVITRGFFYVVYQLIAILVAASALYMFGNKGLYYQLLALILTNVIMIVQSISANGITEFLTEYINLITSFTIETGSVMKVFESTEHCFAFAFFLVFYILTFRKNKKNLPWFLVSLFLFFLGLKRSVLVSVILACVIGGLITLLCKKSARKIMLAIAVILFAAAMAYIIAIHYGLYDWLESIGVNTSGRNWIVEEIQGWYELGIGYLGKGIGYVSGSISIGDLSLVRQDGYSVADIHNDFLRQYIELGCIGYIIWLWIFMVYRVKCFFHKRDTEENRRHGIISASVLITLFITLMTDNTLYYFYTTMFSSMMIMGYRYEEYCEEIKLPGEEYE